MSWQLDLLLQGPIRSFLFFSTNEISLQRFSFLFRRNIFARVSIEARLSAAVFTGLLFRSILAIICLKRGTKTGFIASDISEYLLIAAQKFRFLWPNRDLNECIEGQKAGKATKFRHLQFKSILLSS